MALSPILDSLDGLSEDIASNYAQYAGDEASLKGKFLLQVESAAGWGLENVSGLRNALSSEKEARRRANERAARFVDGDGKALDPVDLVTKLERLAGLESGAIKGDDLDAKLRSEREGEATKWKGKVDGLTQSAAELQEKYETTVKTNAALLAISAHKGKARALLPHVIQACKLRTSDDGHEELLVLGDDGNPRLSVEPGNTGNMTLGEFVGSVLKKDPDFRGNFEGTGASGGGSTGGSQDVNATRIDPNLSPVEQLKLAHQQEAASRS